MPAYTIDGNDDIIAGTPDADTVAGTTGGNDQIDLGGGDDVATIDRIAFFIYDLVDPFNDYWEYFYTGMDSPYQGVLAGGAGRDTLDVGMRTDPPNASVNDFRVEPFSLRETELSGFEVLNTRWQTEISVAQLAGFDEIHGTLDGVSKVLFQLFGSGGTLDLKAKTATPDWSIINARALTSGLRLEGSDGNDTVYDSVHDDHIKGGLGNDTFYYSAGVDYLSGGEGVDTLYIDWAEPASLLFKPVGVQGVLPNGTQFVGFERYFVNGGAQADEITGTAGNDSLSGDDGDDVLYGLGGNDTLFGGTASESGLFWAGHDEVYGGDGDDTIHASGDDLGWGGVGQDLLRGRNGGNVLHGGADNDSLTTEGGDELFGDAGDDQLVFNRGLTDGAVLHGGAGNDTLLVDTLSLFSGLNELYGDDGDDVLTGDSGTERWTAVAASTPCGAASATTRMSSTAPRTSSSNLRTKAPIRSRSATATSSAQISRTCC